MRDMQPNAIMMSIHQIWLGGELPERMQPWVASMQRLALAMGWEHHLWTETELQARYAGYDALRVFERARDIVPECTRYGLASDWYRLALLADFGGMYADTDMEAQDIPALANYELPADVACSNEGRDGQLACIGLLWCRGERGHEAAKLLFRACNERLLRLLPPNADDFATRLVRLARQDECISGIARYGIGPVPFRNEFIPAAAAAGYSCAPVPRPVESDRRHLSTAWMVHNSSAAWYKPAEDWCARAKHALDVDAAERSNRVIESMPAHLRPQGATILPQVRRKAATAAEDAPAVPLDAASVMLRVPDDAKRVVIFSNVTEGMDVRRVKLRRGDFCLHLNRARHLPEAIKVPGTRHALMVRHGLNPMRRIVWFVPGSFDGLGQVLFLAAGNPLERLPWWREYRAATSGKVPTTGFIAANLLRQLAPHLPLVLAGFDPAKRHGTPQWCGHAWHYEAAWYQAHKFNLITPQ